MTPIPLEDLLRFERGELDGQAAERVRDELRRDPEAALSLDWVQALRAGAPGLDAVPPTGPPEERAPASFGEIAQLATGSLGPGEAASVREKLLVTPDGYDLLESALEEVFALGEVEGTPSLESQPPILPGPRPAPKKLPSGGAHGSFPRAAFGALAAAIFVAAGLWLWQRPSPGGGLPAVRSVAGLAEKASMAVPRLRAGTFDAGIEAYERKDFSGAAVLLRAATDEDPSAGTTWLYLGSAELLIGNLSKAAEAFEVARAKCEPSYRVEATWQLAQTRLAQDLPEMARELLHELAGTRRDGDAKEKLRALDLPGPIGESEAAK